MVKETKSKEWQPDFKIEEDIAEPSTISRGLSNLDVREMRVGSGIDNPRILKRGSIIRARFETHQQEDEGIKIYKGVPATVYGNTGFYLPTTNAGPAAPYNGAQWTNPDYAETIDGLLATSEQGTTHYQVWRGFAGLQTNIPANATILGVSVRCYAKADAAGKHLGIWLTKDGSSPVMPGWRKTDELDTSLAYVSVGGGGDLWGTTWTRDDFGSNFGVIIFGTSSTSPTTTYSIDFIQVNVYYKREFTDDTGENLTDSFMSFWSKVGNVLLYLKKNTLDLWIEKANLILKGSLTIDPQNSYTGNTAPKAPTLNNSPESTFAGTWSDSWMWTNPDNAHAPDDTPTTASQGTFKYTVWRGFDLLDDIPTGATINGIKIEARAKTDTGSGEKLSGYIIKDGITPIGSSQESDALDTSYGTVTLGGATNLWGTTWTRGDFNNNFGVMLSGNTASGILYSVDFLQAYVYYTTTDNSTVEGGFSPSSDDACNLGSSLSRYSSIYGRKGIFDDLEVTKIPGYFASDDLLASSDLEKHTTSESYVLTKSIQVPGCGEFRIKFDLKRSPTAGTTYGKIYKNGSAIGTERSTTSETYTTYTEDLKGFIAGDLIQLYIKRVDTTAIARNFRIYGEVKTDFVIVQE